MWARLQGMISSPHLKCLCFIALAFALPSSGNASLALYDSAITADAAGNGSAPVSKLSTAASFDGSDSRVFDFGVTSGAVTMEFIVEGDPLASGQDGYLAVGANASSSLRYEQWNDTGQLGFTQSGVADYLFSPLVLSPTEATHVTYVWDGDGQMDLYLDGTLAGQSSGVSGSFSMPSGSGFLGNNSGGSEGMVGTIHRVTVYDEALAATVIARHADAFNDVTYPPAINAFSASPAAYLAPGSSTLSWDVLDADTLSINGVDVTAVNQLVVSPSVTTVYTLTASNGDGSTTRDLAVTVNPVPSIADFSADRMTINPGESVTLSWQTDFAAAWSISPSPGDVSGQTTAGDGSVVVSPAGSTNYSLSVTNASGAAQAEVTVSVAMVATHPVIAEFMADNVSVLADGDGEFSDWIEIFNPTGAPIDLAGYYLSDDADELGKWEFPAQLLAPGGRLIVFASGKFPTGPAGELHTNFRLDNGGEYLALVAPDGVTVLHEFAPAYPGQSDDVSYGILGGDLAAEQYMGVPTPGAANDPTPAAPAAVAISLPSQTFTGVLNVSLSSTSGGATIYYSVDGTEPSAANGEVYGSPLDIGTTTHLRAIAVLGASRARYPAQAMSGSRPIWRTTSPICR